MTNARVTIRALEPGDEPRVRALLAVHEGPELRTASRADVYALTIEFMTVSQPIFCARLKLFKSAK